MEIRKPLLQGAGVEFNQIAGPGSVPGFNQGVLLARLNTDIALTAFEAGVRNMVADIESAYWDLYFAYRNLDTAVEGRDDSLRTWQKANSLFLKGTKQGGAAYEAQAREQYFGFKVTAEQAQVQLYHAESRLRFLMGIPATDGRLIRPKDDPTTAKISFDWDECKMEAMSRSAEIREARQRVRQRELELVAAKNWMLPQVSLDGRYRWDGMGHDFITNGDSSFSGGAVDNLGSGEFQSWHIGVDAVVPIGFRKQASGVTSAEQSLARDRAKLQDTELEVVNQLTFLVSDMEADYETTITNFNRRAAAERNLAAVQAAYEVDAQGVPFDVLLQAQRTLADAESSYFRSLTNYAKSISQVHRVKGSLLEYNGVYLTEGPWPNKAYFDAHRRAQARASAVQIDYGYTFPRPVDRGIYQQFTGQPMASEDTPATPQTPGTPPTPPGQSQPPRQKREEVPTPPGVISTGLNRQVSYEVPAGDSAPMPAAQPYSGGATSNPRQARHDLGTMDLSGLGANGNSSPAAQPVSAPAAKLDLSGFAPQR
jgi:outer membrane protein TolC